MAIQTGVITGGGDPDVGPTAQWEEKYVGGSPAAEKRAFARLAREIMQVQWKNRRNGAVDRAFHAKATLAVDDARLHFRPDLPPDLEAGFASPDADYRVMVRFSNASGKRQPDGEKDLRGVAMRVEVPFERSHDLLMTNYPVSHARDARQFVKFATATAGSGASVVLGLAKLAVVCGPLQTLRMVSNVWRARTRVDSVATQFYWSRGAIRWGETLAVRYHLRPMAREKRVRRAARRDPDYLAHEASQRLADGDVCFELCVQQFVNSEVTPIEDTSVPWSPRKSRPLPVAVLTIPRRPPREDAEPPVVASLDFNPWNTTDLFRPLGNLNRARKEAYDASAGYRHGYRWETRVPPRNVVIGYATRFLFRLVNRFVPWHRLGVRLGLLNLQALRYVLRRDNLIEAEAEAPLRPRPVLPRPAAAAREWRSFDGRFNDLSDPDMGAVGAGFGRNLPADFHPDLYDVPNPIVVSSELLKRERFLEADSLNLLAAAWLQFQVHDWVSHRRHPLGFKDVVVPLPDGTERWTNVVGGRAEDAMRIAGDMSFADIREGGSDRSFPNKISHWWDASEIYGGDERTASKLREGAKLRLTDAGYLEQDDRERGLTGFNDAWWLGLSGLHTLFAREHNVLCDELRRHHHAWSDDRTYRTARLINAALIAKIHTLEWTPAILATETVDVGMKANWNGPLAQEWLTRLGLWLTDAHALRGIPHTVPDHHGVPFSLTEDFVAVYQMHPLLPDTYAFRGYGRDKDLGRYSFRDIQGDQAEGKLRRLGLANMLYSFGIAHPGQIALHNYPESLRRFERDGEFVDLAVVDLVRTRRRGVPRYNDFRAGLHLPRITRWEELCDNPESVRRMRRIYRSIDEVDTMVGLFAEPKPEGFGFSDTAFRVFLLMAARRLQSDRFLTVDHHHETYTRFGIDWIANNTMTSVIRRHCPGLAAVLAPGANAFRPWHR